MRNPVFLECIARQGSSQINMLLTRKSLENCYCLGLADKLIFVFLLSFYATYINGRSCNLVHRKKSDQINMAIWVGGQLLQNGEGIRLRSGTQLSLSRQPRTLPVRRRYIQWTEHNLLCTCSEGDIISSCSLGGQGPQGRAVSLQKPEIFLLQHLPSIYLVKTAPVEAAIQANHHYSVLSAKSYYIACDFW